MECCVINAYQRKVLGNHETDTRDACFMTTSGDVIVALHKLENGECVYYNPVKKECAIYPFRPAVCKSFPFTFNRKKGPNKHVNNNQGN